MGTKRKTAKKPHAHDCYAMHTTVQATTTENQDGSMPILSAQKPQFPDVNTSQEFRNFYFRHTAPTTVNTVAEPPPAMSPTLTEDDMDTVEKVDAKLLCMEQYWAKS
jgi:hypothetical protein